SPPDYGSILRNSHPRISERRIEGESSPIQDQQGSTFQWCDPVARLFATSGARENIMGTGGGLWRVGINERETPVFGGAEFGAVGSYERLHGIVFGELDPKHPLNAGIVNLDKARNGRGNVEYQSNFRILKPVALDRGNACLVYDVPNRGNQPIMPRLNGAPDGGHSEHTGNGFLMRRGFTLVWSGWQGDV